MTRSKLRRLAVAGGAGMIALALTGCGNIFLQNPNSSDAGSGGGDFVANNAQPDGDGVVTVLGAFGGDEQAAFEASVKDFEDESGIDIQYTADQDFTTTIKTRANSGDAPDIGVFPQPGGLAEFVDDDAVQPIDSILDYDALDKTLVPGFLDFARVDGRVYGAPIRMAVKSVVYYPKKAWDAAGYPEQFDTFQDLMKFADQLKSEGTTPWCMGWGSDQATGWVGTDWVEQMMLVTAGPDVYDQWVDHQIPFNAKPVVESLDVFAEIAKAPGEVFGGEKAIINTPFAEASLPMFDKAGPKCWMERQGNFAIGFFPEQIRDNLDEEVGVFQFPRYEGGYDGTPVLVGGDYAADFNGDDDDTAKVMEFITSADFGAQWAAAGGWLSPHKTFDESLYPNEVTRQIAAMGYDASVIRYDASDLMPKEVGSDSFWTEMVKWIGGDSSQQTADAIEKSWPQ